MVEVPFPDDRATLLSGAARGLARISAAIRARLTGARVLLALGICLFVSTQAFFEPQLYEAFSVGDTLLGWLDYFGECLVMGVPIMLALAGAEACGSGLSRVAGIAIVVAALVAGAVAGRLLLIAYYELGWQDLLARRFWGDVAYWVAIGGGVATIHGLQQRVAAAVAALHQARMDQLAMARQLTETRLQVLRAQIEPHFLFNTLANVKRLCRTDLHDGLAMLANLAQYLRAALPRMRDGGATLGEEAELARAYLSIFRMRMGARLEFDIDIPDNLRAHAFPPMMLLTLCENALKHGLEPLPRGGTIAVRARAIGTVLEVRVTDNGVGFGAAATDGTGIGLANVRARLSALHGDAARFDLVATDPSGVTAIIRTPFEASMASRNAAAPAT